MNENQATAVGLLKHALVNESTPHLCNDNISSVVCSEEALKNIRDVTEQNVARLLEGLLIDYKNDHNTRDTPRRVAKMLVDETFRGRYYPDPSNTEFPNVTGMDQLLVVGPCDVKSTCAHHLQPFIGKAWVGILPSKDGALTGLSKYARIIDHYSRRPQIQEELTSQIAKHLETLLNPRGLLVFIKAKHLCMTCRGVNQNAWTTTSVAHGEMRSTPSLKAEFFSLVGDTDKYLDC
jgi:GTP cyclohydrolase I